MKNVKALAAIFVFAGGISIEAVASVAFSPSVFYYQSRSKDDNSTSNNEVVSNNTDLDFRLGYILPIDLYIGAIYSTDNSTGKSSGTDTSASATRYGASFGFVLGSFSLIGHYMLSAEASTRAGTTSNTYSDGSGMQADAGWNFAIAPSIGFGPQITYLSLNYKKRSQTAGAVTTESNQAYSVSVIEPRLVFWFVF